MRMMKMMVVTMIMIEIMVMLMERMTDVAMAPQ